MTWYYRCEFKGIQRWILESSRLRDLAGGSALVEQLVDQAKRQVAAAGGKIVYAAAGGLLATFPSPIELEQFAGEWPMFAAYHAPGLSLVQAWANDTEGPGALGRLFQRLAARRNLPPTPLLEPGPWLKRASRTGMPAVPPPKDIRQSRARATAWDEASVERERALCGRDGEKKLFKGLLSLDEVILDEERWPDGPIAVIHIDGSGVGRRIVGIGDRVEQLAAFSEALADSTWSATQIALEELRRIAGRGPLPLRPVVLGGDDLTVVVVARYALPFVRAWLTSFEQQTQRRARELAGSLHAGAGVTIVNRGYPFWMAYELADEACREAKHDVLDNGEPSASALRIRRVTTALAGEEESQVTWRLDRLRALDDLVSAVRGLPRGTLRTWLTLLDAGDARLADREALWNRAREVADEQRWKAFAKALEGVGACPETGLFGDETGARMTPLRDAMLLDRLGRQRKATRGGKS